MAGRRLKRTLAARLLRRVRYFYLRLLLLPDTPQRVASGLAAGVFVGMTPTIPFQTVLSIILAWMVRGSKVAAALGTWVTNPLTVPILYPLFYAIGRVVSPFGKHTQLPSKWGLEEIWSIGTEMALASMIGGLVMALILTPVAYFVTLKYIGRLQAWERRKLRSKFDFSPPPVV
jgi:uncharacterized protein